MIRIEYTGKTGRIRQFKAEPITDAEGNVTAYRIRTGSKTADIAADRATVVEPKWNGDTRVWLMGKVHASNGIRMTNRNSGDHDLIPACNSKSSRVYPYELSPENPSPVDCKRCLAQQ